jgi:hypothetical protein
MGIGRYIPVDGEPQEVDTMTWARWFEKGDRTVAKTTVREGVDVSTVFLGLDHRFFGDGPPILWETMIFGGEHDQYQDRYSSLEDAKAGHERAVKLASNLTEEKV